MTLKEAHHVKSNSPTCLYIKGLTKEGKIFRPSDWAERLCGAVAVVTLPENKLSNPLGYNLCALPVVINGVSCVKVYTRLSTEHPLAFEFLLSFAKDNKLEVCSES